MARNTAIHDRVAEVILDAAADLLAGGGEPPSMAEVAAAAGVARATLYRHFPHPRAAAAGPEHGRPRRHRHRARRS